MVTLSEAISSPETNRTMLTGMILCENVPAAAWHIVRWWNTIDTSKLNSEDRDLLDLLTEGIADANTAYKNIHGELAFDIDLPCPK